MNNNLPKITKAKAEVVLNNIISVVGRCGRQTRLRDVLDVLEDFYVEAVGASALVRFACDVCPEMAFDSGICSVSVNLYGTVKNYDVHLKSVVVELREGFQHLPEVQKTQSSKVDISCAMSNSGRPVISISPI